MPYDKSPNIVLQTKNEHVDIKFSAHTTRFMNNLNQEQSLSNDWKTKGPKQDSQYRLRSPILVGNGP